MEEMEETISLEAIEQAFLHSLHLPNAEGLASHILQLEQSRHAHAILSSQFVQDSYECTPTIHYDDLFTFLEWENKHKTALLHELWLSDMSPAHALFGVPNPNSLRHRNRILIVFHCDEATRSSPAFIDTFHLYLQSIFKKSQNINAVRSGEDGMFCFKAPKPATHSNLNSLISWFASPSSHSREEVQALPEKKHENHANHRFIAEDRGAHVRYKLLDCLHSIQPSTYDAVILVATAPIMNLQLSHRTLINLNLPLHIYSFNHFAGTLASLTHAAESSHGSIHSFEGDITEAFPEGRGRHDISSPLFQMVAMCQKLHQVVVSILLKQAELCGQSGSFIEIRADSCALSKIEFEEQTTSRFAVEETWILTNSLEALGLDLNALLLQCIFTPVSLRSALYDHREIHMFDDAHAIIPSTKITIPLELCSLFPIVDVGAGRTAPLYLSEPYCKMFIEGVRSSIQNFQNRIKEFELSSLGVFGRVSYRRVAIVVDNAALLHVYKHLITNLITNLVQCQLVPCGTSFNIVTCEESPKLCFDGLVKATKETALQSISWWKSLPREKNTFHERAQEHGVPGGCIPLHSALKTVQALGTIDACLVLTSRGQESVDLEILTENMHRNNNTIFHTASIACRSPATNSFLHDLAVMSGGTFEYVSSVMLDIFSTQVAIASATQSTNATPLSTPRATPSQPRLQYEIVESRMTTPTNKRDDRGGRNSRNKTPRKGTYASDCNIFSAIGPIPMHKDSDALYFMRLNLTQAHHAIIKAEHLFLESRNAARRATEKLAMLRQQEHQQLKQPKKSYAHNVESQPNILAFASSSSSSSASSRTASPSTHLAISPRLRGTTNNNTRNPTLSSLDASLSSTQPIGDALNLANIAQADLEMVQSIFQRIIHNDGDGRRSISIDTWIRENTIKHAKASLPQLLKQLPSTRNSSFPSNKKVYSYEYKGKVVLVGPAPSCLERYLKLLRVHEEDCLYRYASCMKALMMPSEKQKYSLCSKKKKKVFLDKLISRWEEEGADASIGSVDSAKRYKQELISTKQAITAAKFLADDLVSPSTRSSPKKNQENNCISADRPRSNESNVSATSSEANSHSTASTYAKSTASKPERKKRLHKHNKRYVSEKEAMKHSHRHLHNRSSLSIRTPSKKSKSCCTSLSSTKKKKKTMKTNKELTIGDRKGAKEQRFDEKGKGRKVIHQNSDEHEKQLSESVGGISIFQSKTNPRISNIVFEGIKENKTNNNNIAHNNNNNAAKIAFDSSLSNDIIGRRVLAARVEDGYLYPATVEDLDYNLSKLICRFADNSDQLAVPIAHVFIRWANPTPPLRRGNFVLTDVSLTDYGNAWVPARITGVTVRSKGASLFTAETLNGMTIHGTRRDFVKLSKDDHDRVAKHIAAHVDNHLASLMSTLETRQEQEEFNALEEATEAYMARSITPSSLHPHLKKHQQHLGDQSSQLYDFSSPSQPGTSSTIPTQLKNTWSTIPLDESNDSFQAQFLHQEKNPSNCNISTMERKVNEEEVVEEDEEDETRSMQLEKKIRKKKKKIPESWKASKTRGGEKLINIGIQCDGFPTSSSTQTLMSEVGLHNTNTSGLHTTATHNYHHNRFPATTNSDDLENRAENTFPISREDIETNTSSFLNGTQHNISASFLSSARSLAWDDGNVFNVSCNMGPESDISTLPNKHLPFDMSLTTHAALEMVHERTIAILLPQVVKNEKVDDIIAQLADEGIRVVISKMMQIPTEVATELFWEQRSDSMFSSAISMLCEGPSLVCILAGPDVVNKWARIANNPVDLGGMDMRRHSAESPIVPSLLLHASKSSTHAEKEIALFFDPKSPPLEKSMPLRSITVTNHEDDAIMCRKALDLFGETILARWKHDGWFYQYVLADYLGGGVFCGKDEDGNVEALADNTVLFLSMMDRPSKVGQKVLAEHPQYEFSFAPGVVSFVDTSVIGSAVEVDEGNANGELTIVFYDNMGVLLCDVIAYVLPDESLFDELCAFSQSRDKDVINCDVVCRYDDDGLFYHGTVLEQREDPGRAYDVLFDDGHKQIQDRMHIVSHNMDDESSKVLNVGDNVISLSYHGEPGDDYEYDIYEPGTISRCANKDKFIVETWSGKQVAVRRKQLFYIPPSYFNIACDYIKAV
eukprot:m.69801 g.69801  ORF g.69801 m.69801 type:complete len:2131 (-) comp8286_c1_seq1:38-6430(-)